MGALKIIMKTNGGRGPGLFMHDVLYNISIEEREGGKVLVMNCMTGDMQMDESGRVSRMQAKGKTAITLVKQSGIASMDRRWIWQREVGHESEKSVSTVATRTKLCPLGRTHTPLSLASNHCTSKTVVMLD